MAVKVLGQASPSAGGIATVYTCPIGKKFICSAFWACTQDTVPVVIKMYLRRSNTSVFDIQAQVLDDMVLAPNTFGIIQGILAGSAGDSLLAFASTANTSFSAFGDES